MLGRKCSTGMCQFPPLFLSELVSCEECDAWIERGSINEVRDSVTLSRLLRTLEGAVTGVRCGVGCQTARNVRG